MISGNGVFYLDKTPTQRIGIVPDVELKPTMRESVPAGTRSWRKPCVRFTASANYALPCCVNNQPQTIFALQARADCGRKEGAPPNGTLIMVTDWKTSGRTSAHHAVMGEPASCPTTFTER